MDNLHERAGSTNTLHLHGELCKVCASNDRYNEAYVKDYPLTIPLKECDLAGDGSQLRPYIVMFGENVTNIMKAAEIVRQANVFVVIGTSLIVYPAAMLLDIVPKGAKRFIIDPAKVQSVDELGYTHIQAKASEGMEALVDIIDEMDATGCLDDCVAGGRHTYDSISHSVDVWQMKDAIMTVVEANHYSVWDIRQTAGGFRVELNETLTDDAASLLCGQFPLSADCDGKGKHGTTYSLYC